MTMARGRSTAMRKTPTIVPIKRKNCFCFRNAFLVAVAVTVIGKVYFALNSSMMSNVGHWWEEPLSFDPVITKKSNPTSAISQSSKSIRQWGCGLKDTPLIFVHIGKAGGGSVRARLAASSLNFSLRKKWFLNHQAYYPIRTRNGTQLAHFCNGEYRNYRPRVMEKNFEPTFQCYATTPLGMAIACPELFPVRFQKITNCPHDPASDSAHVVYAGHNYFGFEMHWLPEPYLSNWWKQHWATQNDPITPLLKTLHPMSAAATWCDQSPREVFGKRATIDFQTECGKKMQPNVDRMATKAFAARLKISESEVSSWAPLYASLPLLRVVVIRDPFSWLISKFLWHESTRKYNLTCDDIDVATYGSGNSDPHAGSNVEAVSLINDRDGPGWARRMALGFIHQICGEDCVARTYNGQSTLNELELQAEENLRQGFAVVGLLNETNQFYDMLYARVDYLNTSLNQKVRHHNHKANANDTYSLKCRERFSDPKFQNQLVAASPEVAALQRLFHVAVKVNRFQMKELWECRNSAI